MSQMKNAGRNRLFRRREFIENLILKVSLKTSSQVESLKIFGNFPVWKLKFVRFRLFSVQNQLLSTNANLLRTNELHRRKLNFCEATTRFITGFVLSA